MRRFTFFNPNYFVSLTKKEIDNKVNALIAGIGLKGKKISPKI